MSITDSLRRLVNSPGFKFILVMVLILVLTVPLLFVYLMVSERQSYARRAQAEVGQMWSRAQTVRGPFIVVPTTRTEELQTKDGIRKQLRRAYAIFLPEILNVTSDIRSERRRRGIFSVPVYRSTISFTGKFVQPITTAFDQSDTTLNWNEAVLVLTVADVRGIKKTAELKIGTGPDATSHRFRAGTGLNVATGIHVPITEGQAKTGFDFTFDLPLNGSRKMHFIPAGGETEVKIKSDWPHPSFTGAYLPDKRTVSETGFSATWTIPRLARGYGQTLHQNTIARLMNTKAFGVQLFQPVRFYSLAERALKYALGFVAIAFLAVFVMEIQSRRRVHWIQYLFVGLALIIFYLVLIGTAEHIGFDMGYLGAATATSALIGTYVGSVMRSLPRGAAVAGVLIIIYGLLYLLLRIEDYAMLIGSLAAFALLATVMFATRDVDWSRGGEQVKEG